MANEEKLNINDIAERAGVSIATVSRYLHGRLEKMSDKTANRIKQIIEETGYVPNASAVQLMTQRSGLIAIVAADVDDYFSTEFFKGASSILEAESLGHHPHQKPPFELRYMARRLPRRVSRRRRHP